MKRGGWLLAIAVAAGAAAAAAQDVGFLTEPQRLASYCAGVSEARMRQLENFIKTQCAGSKRKECRDAESDFDKAKIMDRRLWSFLTTEIINSPDQGPKGKAWSQRVMMQGSDDWVSCQKRPAGQRDTTLPCREAQGCLIEARFRFLPP